MQIDNKLQQKLKYQAPQFQLCKTHDHQNNELRYIGKNQDQIFNLQCESCILENKEMQNLNLEQIFEQIQESNQQIFAQSYVEFENIDNLIGKLGNNLIQVAETLTNLKTQFKKKWKAQLNHLIEQTNRTLRTKMNNIITFQKSEKDDDYLQSHKLQQHLKNLNSVLIKEQNKYVMKTDDITDYIKKQKDEIFKQELHHVQSKIKDINDTIQSEIEINLHLKKGSIEYQQQQQRLNETSNKEEQKEGYEESFNKKNQYFQNYKTTHNSMTSENTHKNSQNFNGQIESKNNSDNQLNILKGTHSLKRQQKEQYTDSENDKNSNDMEDEENSNNSSNENSHYQNNNFKDGSYYTDNNTQSHRHSQAKVTKKIKKIKNNDLDKILKKEQHQQQQQQHKQQQQLKQQQILQQQKQLQLQQQQLNNNNKQKKKISANNISSFSDEDQDEQDEIESEQDYSSSSPPITQNKNNSDFGKTCCADNCLNDDSYDDKVLFCKGCKMGFHSKCLGLDFWLAQVNSSQSPWKCKKCQSCEVCHKKVKSTSQMEYKSCKLCDRSYHIECMTKKEVKYSNREGESWCCSQCRKCPNCLECKNCKEKKECNNKKTKCNNVIWTNMNEDLCQQARQKKRNCDKCWERHKKIYNQDNSYDFCFLCMKIHKRGSSKSCKCHGCEAWVHTRCDPNAEEYFKQHKNLKHQIYYCPQCEIIFNQQGKKHLKMNDEINVSKDQK